MVLLDRGQVQVVNLVGSEALPDLEASLRDWEWTVWRLDGSDVIDGETLFQRATTDLPSPFPGRDTTGFDSFADSLWEAAVTSRAEDIAVVWTDAQQMLRGGLGDLLVAVSILRRLSQRLAESTAPTGFSTFLVGSGPNFPLPPSAGEART